MVFSQINIDYTLQSERICLHPDLWTERNVDNILPVFGYLVHKVFCYLHFLNLCYPCKYSVTEQNM